jgi:hypothetical protein
LINMPSTQIKIGFGKRPSPRFYYFCFFLNKKEIYLRLYQE